MNDDEKEAIAQEVLREDSNRERGVRPEWQTHEGWHRREDTGRRFDAAHRARAAARDAEAKKKKLYHDGWEAEADASAEALMQRPETRPPSPVPRDNRPYAVGAAAAALVVLLCYYRRRRRRRRGGGLHLSSSAELLVDLEEAVVEVVGAGAPKDD